MSAKHEFETRKNSAVKELVQTEEMRLAVVAIVVVVFVILIIIIIIVIIIYFNAKSTIIM